MHAGRSRLGHEQLYCVDGGSSHYDHGNECRDDAGRLKGKGDGEQGTAPDGTFVSVAVIYFWESDVIFSTRHAQVAQ